MRLMLRALFVLSTLVSVAWGFSASRPKISAPGTLRVYFSGQREGEVEPCGCQVHQLGGLDRLATYFKNEKPEADAKIFVEAGDSFFSLPEMDPSRVEREKLKAKVMADVFKRLSLDALTPGERDFVGGLPFLLELEKASGATFLAANLETLDGKHPFAASRVLERSGLKIGLVGIVGKKALERVGGIHVTDPGDALKAALSDFRDKGVDAVVVVSHQGLEDDRKSAGVEGVDLVVGAHSLDALAEPVHVGGAAIVQTLNQGQQIGRIRLKLPGRECLDHQVTNLDTDTPSDAEVLKAIKDNKEATRLLALKQSEHSAPVADGKPFVAHSAYCKNCHAKQYDFWAQTKHASAILVLYAKNQHLDPECIVCHSLGFQEPGGFSKIAKPLVFDPEGAKTRGAFVETFLKGVFQADAGRGALDSRKQPGRHAKLHQAYWRSLKRLEEKENLAQNYLGVQCEHCHGNRNGHPGEGVTTLKKVSENSCKGCHTPPHAAPYDPKNFPKVACPLSSKI